jgi:PncC family amidohydrolase
MQKVNASIITIGDELLIGQTVDTNSSFIGQELNKIGIWVKRKITVGDEWDDIWQALDEESRDSQVIIITGGLGPTADDITKPLLCKYFNGKLIENEMVLAHINYLFEQVFRRPGPLLERNRKQAEVPDVCTVLMNEKGTAPGMLFRQPRTSPNPSEGGAYDLQRGKVDYGYITTDATVYALLKKYMLEHRSKPTRAEEILWSLLKGKKIGGFRFRRQHIIGPYIADFVCIRQKLIIEVDGLIHQLPENKKSDAERTVELKRYGFHVIRFTNEQVTKNTDDVLNEILTHLKRGNPQLSDTNSPPSEGQGEVFFFALPGVPYEMKDLVIKQVIPYLQKNLTLPVIVHQTLLTVGVGESVLAESIKDWEESLAPHIKLAYLPHFGTVRLRLTATGNDKNILDEEMEKKFEELKQLVKEWLVIDEDMTLAQAIARLLKSRKQTVGTAESCTGGYLAHLLSRDPGSSSNYKGSIISYDNQVKVDLLDVPQKTLDEVGAVSEETVVQMAKAALKQLKTDYVVATSGIMGPDGGSEKKPVGLVWIAVGDKNNIIAKEFHFKFDRNRNIEQTSITALNMLRKLIIES